MSEKTPGLLSFNAAMGAMSLPGREAMLERSFALQIGGKMNYKDAFENTPENIVASIVRQFKFWYDGLGPEEQNSFLLLANNAAFTKDFIEYLCNKKPEIERLFDEAPQALQADVSAFLAMHCYDAKIEVQSRGNRPFSVPTVSVWRYSACSPSRPGPSRTRLRDGRGNVNMRRTKKWSAGLSISCEPSWRRR